MPNRLLPLYIICILLALLPSCIATAEPPAAPQQPNAQHHHAAPAADTRTLVELPPALRAHMLANMRLHVSALNEIIAALAADDEDKAAHIAEWQLGLSSLKAHHAAELGKFMPKPMQEIGGAMHRAASRFAIAAQNAGATGDLRPALAALSEVTAQCAACHADYRVH